MSTVHFSRVSNKLTGSIRTPQSILAKDKAAASRETQRVGSWNAATTAITKEFDFNKGLQGFKVFFTDYPSKPLSPSEPPTRKAYELAWGEKNLPAPLDTSKKGLLIEGHNYSDDLRMVAKKQIRGLKPNTTYKIDVAVSFATNAPSKAVGIGGAPGESVFLKIGASSIEPKPVVVASDDHYYRMNLDIGNQSTKGPHGRAIGNIANGTPRTTYKVKTIQTKANQHLTAKTDNQGRLWILFGTDSGFEGKTSLYYTKLSVQLNEQTKNPSR